MNKDEQLIKIEESYNKLLQDLAKIRKEFLDLQDSQDKRVSGEDLEQLKQKIANLE